LIAAASDNKQEVPTNLVELVLVSSEHMKVDIRYPFLCAACSLLAGFMFKDWKGIVDLAGPIFSNAMSYQNVNSRSIQDREGKKVYTLSSSSVFS
jgi:hypothetical protein